MRDYKPSRNMSNNYSPRRQNGYVKEMDHAFTLIFHNIKRLQEDRLCISTSSLDRPQHNHQQSMKQPKFMTLTERKTLERARCRSESSLEMLEKCIRQREKFSDHGSEYPFFSCDEDSSLRRRKVRFADDYVTRGKFVYRESYLAKRSISDIHWLGQFKNYFWINPP